VGVRAWVEERKREKNSKPPLRKRKEQQNPLQTGRKTANKRQKSVQQWRSTTAEQAAIAEHHNPASPFPQKRGGTKKSLWRECLCVTLLE